jgi:2-polyprenyl-6-methoxyphenol hydroxylase-like FAD-dependent oxidoreductase
MEAGPMADYDVIVVGARVAGAATARLLAASGHRVLLVDRATFPSDTISTHLIHAPGMAALARWGLAERVVATGTPPVTTYRVDLGPFAIVGRPRGLDDAPFAFAPRRTSLDALLVEAAAAVGAEVREGFGVEGLIVEDGIVRGIRGRGATRPVSERARVVVGADGVRSFVAAAVDARVYHEMPVIEALYYAYWSGLPTDGEFQLYTRDRRGFGMIPTESGQTVAVVTWPMDEFESNRHEVLGNYLKAFDADPILAGRVAGATRESRVVGFATPNRYRQSHGPGWALVGDAAYVKDPVTAQGITDAFLDAESLSAALDEALSGRRSFEDALGEHQRTRDDRTMALFELTCQLASNDPPSEAEGEQFAAIASDREASDDFASVIAGTMPVADFIERWDPSAAPAASVA